MNPFEFADRCRRQHTLLLSVLANRLICLKPVALCWRYFVPEWKVLSSLEYLYVLIAAFRAAMHTFPSVESPQLAGAFSRIGAHILFSFSATSRCLRIQSSIEKDRCVGQITGTCPPTFFHNFTWRLLRRTRGQCEDTDCKRECGPLQASEFICRGH